MAAPWRRLGSPCLETEPWRSALVEGRSHLVKGVFGKDSYEVLVWDMRAMWVENVEREELAERMKSLNPNIEAPVFLILAHLSSLLQAPLSEYTCTQATPTDTTGGEGKALAITGTMSGLPFAWKFQCRLATDDMLQKHVVSPLMSIARELSRQKEELVGIIKRKDREIQDYKDGGASISRRHLETAPFDEKAFNSSMTLSEDFERSVRCSAEVLASEQFQDMYRNVGMVGVWEERKRTEGPSEAMPTTTAASCDSTTGTWAEKIPSSLLPPSHSPSLSTSIPPPTSSHSRSPAKRSLDTSPDTSPAKDDELGRREALERKLEDERAKQSRKKKKKLM